MVVSIFASKTFIQQRLHPLDDDRKDLRSSCAIGEFVYKLSLH